MSKSLKFDRVANLDYLSAYEVIENLVKRFGVADVQNALNEIAAQQSVQSDVCPTCKGAKFVIDWSMKTQSVCPDCSGNRR